MSNRFSGPYELSDLPMSNGLAYHLGVSAADIAKDILIVGDPERATSIAEEHLEAIEARGNHRGLITCTGKARSTGRRLTITTSGMGTGSTEIVLNELAALHEIDPITRVRRPIGEPLTIIRVGTSGALHGETNLGGAVISNAAVGLDSTGWFYEVEQTSEESDVADRAKELLERCLSPGHFAQGVVRPYAASASPEVVRALTASAQERGISTEVGVTVTAPGFFACQGRDISRIPPVFRDLDRSLARDPLFRNLEMESSFLLRFCRGMGYRGGVICVAAANREHDKFCENVPAAIGEVVEVAIAAFGILARG